MAIDNQFREKEEAQRGRGWFEDTQHDWRGGTLSPSPNYTHLLAWAGQGWGPKGCVFKPLLQKLCKDCQLGG